MTTAWSELANYGAISYLNEYDYYSNMSIATANDSYGAPQQAIATGGSWVDNFGSEFCGNGSADVWNKVEGILITAEYSSSEITSLIGNQYDPLAQQNAIDILNDTAYYNSYGSSYDPIEIIPDNWAESRCLVHDLHQISDTQVGIDMNWYGQTYEDAGYAAAGLGITAYGVATDSSTYAAATSGWNATLSSFANTFTDLASSVGGLFGIFTGGLTAVFSSNWWDYEPEGCGG